MLIEPFCTYDITRFLELADTENWVAEAWEFEFLLLAFPHGCLVARDGSGTACGFVTALLHERSGWIGNLIVDPASRGRGIGEALFMEAFNALRRAGAETVWLTASEMGRSLYERHGFRTIDTVNRWTGKGAGGGLGEFETALRDSAIDLLGWGDRRGDLLQVVCRRGCVLSADDMFAVVQPAGKAAMIGPFAAADPIRAPQLCDAAVAQVPAGTKIFIDVPGLNHEAAEMLQARGFRRQGRNDLMYAGVKPDYRPEYIYGLATMGSCG